MSFMNFVFTSEFDNFNKSFIMSPPGEPSPRGKYFNVLNQASRNPGVAQTKKKKLKECCLSVSKNITNCTFLQ